MTPPRPVPRLIPRREFFADPERARARLAPDGTRLAYLAPHGGQLNVWVRTLDQDDDRPVTSDGRRGVTDFRWSCDSSSILFHQDFGGDENWHLHRVAVHDPDAVAVDLTPWTGAQARLLKEPRHLVGTVYVTANARDERFKDLWRVELITGEAELVRENHTGIRSWLVDEHGELRAATRVAADQPELVDLVVPHGDGWRPIGRYGAMDVVFTNRIAPDGRAWVVTRAPERDLSALVLLDLETGEEELVASDPLGRVDVYVPYIRPQTGELLAILYEDDRLRFDVRNDVMAEVFALAGQIQGGDAIPGSYDDAQRHWIVSFTSDVDPGATYLVDRETGQHELLWRPRPWLAPEDLAPMRPAVVRSRDGLDLVSYLTLPAGHEPERLPTVLLVHGGPWARDRRGYHPQVQFLANRGYAVLQVNYRGSIGFGRAFAEAAIGEFGKAMLDDLVDAIEWAVLEGYSDPERIAIYGGSYGGYAALCGLTFAPEVFASGISMVGPSSLLTLLDSFPPYWQPLLGGSWHRFLGHPDDPDVRDRLRDVSPLYHVDRIRAPLLVLQGANDPRVIQRESDQMVRALHDRGVTVEYLLARDEGHGFKDPITRQASYRAIEVFLGEHLGGRVEQGMEPDVAQRLESLRVDPASLTALEAVPRA